MKTVLIISLIANLGIVYVAYKALEYRAHINEFLDKYTNVVEEFSGRDHYRLENLQLAEKKTDSNRVVFIGSQLTEGWDLATDFDNYEVINRGISGQLLAGFLLRFSSDVIQLKPRTVVIEFASYNFRAQYKLDELQDYIATLATLARANEIEPILTTVIPTRTHLFYEGYAVSDSVAVFNNWLHNYCDEHKYQLVDFSAILADTNGLLPQELSISDIEPNMAGYDLLSKATRDALEETR